MIYRLEYIKDIVGTNFVGINIYKDAVLPFLEKMKHYTGDEYDEYVKYQQERDSGHYHCTIFNVADFHKISKDINNINILDEIINTAEINDFQIIDVGSVQRNNNKCYFIVCRSKILQSIRRRFKLEEIDLHITIGFKWKDVHGIRKNEVLPNYEPFIHELSKYYYDFDNSFDFIKELENYDYDLNKEIFVVRISPTYANFKVGNEHGTVDIFTVTIIGDVLRIACKWQGKSEENPYLSDTIILRKFGKN
jgi:hypothetical protein